MQEQAWPKLSVADWEPTYKTLHRWTQIVGKVALNLCAPRPHWWHTTLRFRARGLSTLLMPFGQQQLEIYFDFFNHKLLFDTTSGAHAEIALEPKSVADMYAAVRSTLEELGVEARIWPVPVEVPERTPFDQDRSNASYDREAVERMWTILARCHGALSRSTSDFVGKVSPVHFFWGAFDLAVTRFSGRPNPSPPEDPVMSEAYSQEVISHGFWFGGDWPMGGRVEEPVFYAYALPEPAGLKEAPIAPAAASYSSQFGEFILPYAAVADSAHPDRTVLDFVRTTYAAAAHLAEWPQELTRR